MYVDGDAGPVTVYFEGDTSALVALSWKDKAQNVVKVISQNSEVRLLPYHRYKTLVDHNALKVTD